MIDNYYENYYGGYPGMRGRKKEEDYSIPVGSINSWKDAFLDEIDD